MSRSCEDLAPAVINLTCEIQQIASPTFREARKAEFIQRKFSDRGLQDVQCDAAGNVLARIPGRNSLPPLVFSAHLDTVFPESFPLTLERSPDRISGPSIGDNSLGLAGLLTIPTLLENSGVKPAGDIWLAATTGEEGLGNLQGIGAVAVRFGSGPAAYISIEGMGIGNILHRGLGVERFRVSVHTAGGHSWVDYGDPSAVHQISKLAARLSEIRLPKKPRTTFNIGIIQGGTSINTIASSAWMELDLRSESAAQLASLSSSVRSAVEAARRPNIEILCERIGYRPSGELDPRHPLVVRASKILTGMGLPAMLEIASTEANLPLSLGFPAITIGLTTGDHAHTAHEYIHTAPIAKGLLQLQQLIEQAWTP